MTESLFSVMDVKSIALKFNLKSLMDEDQNNAQSNKNFVSFLTQG